MRRSSVVTSVLLVCAGIAGCGGSGATYQALVLVTAEPPGSRCPDGGQVIASGLDRNRNGTLDPSEIGSSQVVCHGAAPVLTRKRPEPAGTVCPHGGIAVDTGSDRNGNGALDDGEVSGTSFVCDATATTPLLV